MCSSNNKNSECSLVCLSVFFLSKKKIEKNYIIKKLFYFYATVKKKLDNKKIVRFLRKGKGQKILIWFRALYQKKNLNTIILYSIRQQSNFCSIRIELKYLCNSFSSSCAIFCLYFVRIKNI